MRLADVNRQTLIYTNLFYLIMFFHFMERRPSIEMRKEYIYFDDHFIQCWLIINHFYEKWFCDVFLPWRLFQNLFKKIRSVLYFYIFYYKYYKYSERMAHLLRRETCCFELPCSGFTWVQFPSKVKLWMFRSSTMK